MADRQAIHAYVSLEAQAGWVALAEENGVSVTSLIEALGLELRAEIKEAGDADIRVPWVKAARKIDASRRRRG